MPAELVTSFRMYNAVPRAAAAWRRLFERVFAETGTRIDIIEHGAPHPIAELWARPGLACAFMCGWPYLRAGTMQPIAAPVPSPARYEGLPRYCSEFLVRSASGWNTIEETFGSRIGWMARDSQSSYNAPRAFLAAFRRPQLYAESIGPLGSPMQALEALKNEKVDVVAIDGFYLDLLRYHEPARLGGIRAVATTPWAPIPLLVAAPDVGRPVVSKLGEHLLSLHESGRYKALLDDAQVLRFVRPVAAEYGVLEDMARSAAAMGYPELR